MDLELSDEQELLQRTTRRLLSSSWPTTKQRRWIDDPQELDRTLWQQGAGRGWTAFLVPGAMDGGTVSGDGIADLAIIVEELGRALYNGPVIPTNVVAFALAEGGTEGGGAGRRGNDPWTG